MEVEKRKTKRTTREEEDRDERVKKMKLKLKGSEEEGSGAPKEEEVEEFYAILRRMKVVVKYFDDRGRDWREALEKPELTVDHGGENIATIATREVDDMGRKKNEKGILENNQGFDLNAMAPEAAESGGA